MENQNTTPLEAQTLASRMPQFTLSRVLVVLGILCLIIMMIPLFVSGQSVDDWKKAWNQKDEQHRELDELRTSIEENMRQLTQQMEDANRRHSIVQKQISVIMDEKQYIEDMADRTRSGDIGEGEKKNSIVPLLPVLHQAMTLEHSAER